MKGGSQRFLPTAKAGGTYAGKIDGHHGHGKTSKKTTKKKLETELSILTQNLADAWQRWNWSTAVDEEIAWLEYTVAKKKIDLCVRKAKNAK